MKTFEQLGIKIPKNSTGQVKVLCPKCSFKRKKSDEPCLSVNLDTGQFQCWNCGYVGGTKERNQIKEHFGQKSYTRPKYDLYHNRELSDEVAEYLEDRGISQRTMDDNFIASTGRNEIIFPYVKDDVVNIKYRTLDKKFHLVKGAETCFYGIQNLFEDGHLATRKVYITEGEIDALSLYECGFIYSLSVPSGAGVEEEGRPQITPKMEYMEDPDIISIFENVDEVILVTDADYKGTRLRDELGKRIGIDRCSYVAYPSDCKDINDVLVEYGRDKVIELVLNPEPMLQGLKTVNSTDASLLSYYKDGLQPGLISGINALDDVYTLQYGLVTLVTGIPEIKKSVTLDNMMVRYAEKHDIHIAMFSPETKPLEFHVGRLACIHNGHSLSKDYPNYMPYDVFKKSVDWVGKHFAFLQPKENTLEEILQLAKLSVMKYGTKILVIDPYSRMRVDSEAEDKFIRKMLNEVSDFAARYNVHVFIVAHPKKVETIGKAKDDQEIKNYPPITPYDIKGASEWYQSADFILSLWRDMRVEDAPLTIIVMKSKFWHVAKTNEKCQLKYDYSNWQLYSNERLTNKDDNDNIDFEDFD